MSKQDELTHPDASQSTEDKVDYGTPNNDTTEKVEAQEVKVGPEYPDGGLKAWSVVFGAACITFSTFGFTNSFGVFQAYYEETLLPTTSRSAISWIGSIQYALVFIPALPTGRLLDLGYLNAPLAVFSACFVAAVFLVAECKTYWQLLLCQGIAVGAFAGFTFGPTLPTVTHWFQKRRFVAQGLIAVGSSIGGTVLPIATRILLKRVGYPWTIRIIGFILLFTLSLGNLLVRRRLSPRRVTGGLFNWKAFKKLDYTMFVIACNVMFLGLYVPLTYIDISAQNTGISSDVSFYFVSIANCGSMFGRVGAGLIADKAGSMNTLIPFTMVAALMTYCWPYATSIGALVPVALIYGACSGALISLISGPPSRMGDMGDVGRRVGMVITCTAGGAVAGPPIAGAIRTATGNFKAVGAYAGSMILGGTLLFAVSRHVFLGQWKGKF